MIVRQNDSFSMRQARLWLALCLAAGFIHPVFAQSPSPSLAAAVEVLSPNVFQNEEFKLTFLVSLKGVTAEKDMPVLSLPEDSLLHCGEFHELPTRQFVENGQACELRRSFCVARAPAPGHVTVAPVLRIGVLTGRRHFFTNAPEIATYDVRVTPLILNVSPLPSSGRPPFFSGAVGRFSFDADVAPTNVTMGTLIRMTFRIRGAGYLETIVSPRLAESHLFRIYDPKPVPAAAGEKAFEQIIIPQSTNALIVPAVSFPYFDPGAGVYRTLSRGPFPLAFTAAAATPPVFEPYHPPATSVGLMTAKAPLLQVPFPKSAGTPNARGWLVLAMTAAVLMIIVILIGTTVLWRHPATLALTMLGVAVLLAFSLRLAVNRGWFADPEAIVVKRESARFAPSYSAVTSFELPEGISVRIADVRGSWAKISLGEKRGWIPVDALKRP